MEDNQVPEDKVVKEHLFPDDKGVEDSLLSEDKRALKGVKTSLYLSLSVEDMLG